MNVHLTAGIYSEKCTTRQVQLCNHQTPQHVLANQDGDSITWYNLMEPQKHTQYTTVQNTLVQVMFVNIYHCKYLINTHHVDYKTQEPRLYLFTHDYINKA